MPAPVCRAWRKPRPAGGRKSERRLKPPLPRLRLRLRLRLRRQQLRRQQLRRTRLRLRTTSGASIRGEHRGRASGASIGGEYRGRHRRRASGVSIGGGIVGGLASPCLALLASPSGSPSPCIASQALASPRLARVASLASPHLPSHRLASLASALTLASPCLALPRSPPSPRSPSFCIALLALASPRLTRPRLGEPRLASLASALANRAPAVASSIPRLQMPSAKRVTAAMVPSPLFSGPPRVYPRRVDRVNLYPIVNNKGGNLTIKTETTWRPT